MALEINWPETSYELPGLMGFSAEYVSLTAHEYLQKIKPLVRKAIFALEAEIKDLKLEKQQLLEELHKKPRVRYDHSTGNWLVIHSVEG